MGYAGQLGPTLDLGRNQRYRPLVTCAILEQYCWIQYGFVDVLILRECGERERGNVVAQATLQSCCKVFGVLQGVWFLTFGVYGMVYVVYSCVRLAILSDIYSGVSCSRGWPAATVLIG